MTPSPEDTALLDAATRVVTHLLGRLDLPIAVRLWDGRRIAAAGAPFVSRGDDSGTERKEKSYWQRLGITVTGAPWHVSAGRGMGEVLTMAGEMQAYTLSDRATFASYQAKTGLEILVQGDARMFNPYGIMAVSPAKYPDINSRDAMALIDWLTGDGGRAAISAFRPKGEQLFFVTPASAR